MLVRKCKTGGAFEALPNNQMDLDLNRIKNKFHVIADLPMLAIIECNGYEVTCYKNGKLIMKCKTKEAAEGIAEEVYKVAK